MAGNSRGRETDAPLRAARGCGVVVALLGALLVAPAAVRAQQSLALARASALAHSGRCDETLELLQAGADDANGSRLLLQGQCALALGDLSTARTVLERAAHVDPELPHVELILASLRYREGDLEGARAALDAADAASADRAEAHLLRGLLLLHEARPEEALDSFDRARARRPEAVEPAASFVSGIAYRWSGDEQRSREAFLRVVVGYPGTIWAEEAERALAR